MTKVTSPLAAAIREGFNSTDPDKRKAMFDAIKNGGEELQAANDAIDARNRQDLAERFDKFLKFVDRVKDLAMQIRGNRSITDVINRKDWN